jgi:HK97 family phage portal protein
MPQTSSWRASLARLRDRVVPQSRPTPSPDHAPDTKAHRASPFVTINGPRAPQWAPRDYTAFAREGFMQNAIVYRAVRMIAEAAGSVPLLVYDGDSDLDTHPLKHVLTNPHATTTTADLIEQLVGYLLVSGNSYIEAIAAGGEIRALHALRPDRMHIVPGPDGWPDAFDYTLDGQSTRLSGDALDGIPRVLHMKLFHPLNDHYGMSPIEAAASAIDLHNAASAWNKSLLDNSARPSGALIYTARDGNLTTDQFERLKRELESGFQGALNAGRPLLLKGGLDWKAMSLSPKDMDFGIPGDSTYSNYQEANRAFWRHTVIPLVNRIAAALTTWLARPLSETLSIRPDYDQVDALTPERDALWTRLNASSFLTTNEKRQAAGYGAHTQGDDLKRAFSAFMSRGGFNPTNR